MKRIYTFVITTLFFIFSSKTNAQVTILKSTVGSNHYFAQIRIVGEFVRSELSLGAYVRQGAIPRRPADLGYAAKVTWGGDAYYGIVSFYVTPETNYFWNLSVPGLLADTLFSFTTKPCQPILAALPQYVVSNDSIRCQISVSHDTSYAGTVFFTRFFIKNAATGEQRIVTSEGYADTVSTSTVVTVTVPKRSLVTGVPYEVTADVYNGCGTATTVVSRYAPTLGTVFPNPTTDEVWLTVHDGTHHVLLTTITGQRLFATSFTGTAGRISLGKYPAGVYVCVIDGLLMKKIVKQ